MRDQLLGRDTDDVDLAIPGDPKRHARGSRAPRAERRSSSAARSAPGASSGREHAWHVDLVTLRDDDIHADLAQRDFTINAMAEPLGGGELLDPHGGRADLERRLVRMVSARALRGGPAAQPAGGADRGRARTSRSTRRPARRRPTTPTGSSGSRPSGSSPSSSGSSPPTPCVRGLELMDAYGLTDVVLPRAERAARDRAEPLPSPRRPRPHARGARRRSRCCSAIRPPRASTTRSPTLLAEPLSDELTRGQAMRWAALLHDAAKPQTRGVLPGGRVTFMGHDVEGAELARDVLGRLRASPAAARLRRRDHRATTSTPASSSTSARSTGARSGATCAPPSPTAPTSRSSPSPTGSPRAAATPRRRSRPTWRSPRELLAAARAEDAGGPPSRSCAATS